jgi:UDP-N-acetylglucosamine--N-acetylmuramyl-(pentapeptide) pyrophosphoryl-undecaprenol N-acetylglucosamine transferase
MKLIYRVVEYIDRMLEAYCVADVALCRGGATTVAELTCVGLPSIIVPYPYHRDRQQERHAEVLERAGAAWVVSDKEATTEVLAERLEALVADDEVRARMAREASVMGRPDAAFRLAEIVRKAGT